MDLFSSDAIIHEPFSKLREGLKGEQTIESFLKILIMPMTPATISYYY